MKIRRIIFSIIIFLFSLFLVTNIYARPLNLKYLNKLVKKEVSHFKRFPSNGWWQIENLIKRKYNIIIPIKYLRPVQRYYAKLIIDKNHSRIDGFVEFSQLSKFKIFPDNIIPYAKKYFYNPDYRIMKRPAVKKKKNFNYVPPKKIKTEKVIPIQIETIKPIHSVSDTYYMNKNFSRLDNIINNLDKLLNKDKENLTDKIENMLTKTRTLNSYSTETNKVEDLKKELLMTKKQVRLLNNLLSNMISQIDLKFDVKIQAAYKENERLKKQIKNASALIKYLKNNLVQQLREVYNKNVQLSSKSKNLSNNLLDLSDLIKQLEEENELFYITLKNSKNSIAEIKQNYINVIEKLKKDNLKLLQSNRKLKERLDYKENNSLSPYDENFEVKLKNQ